MKRGTILQIVTYKSMKTATILQFVSLQSHETYYDSSKMYRTFLKNHANLKNDVLKKHR